MSFYILLFFLVFVLYIFLILTDLSAARETVFIRLTEIGNPIDINSFTVGSMQSIQGESTIAFMTLFPHPL